MVGTQSRGLQFKNVWLPFLKFIFLEEKYQ
jgi:hypothetical protein